MITTLNGNFSTLHEVWPKWNLFSNAGTLARDGGLDMHPLVTPKHLEIDLDLDPFRNTQDSLFWILGVRT